MVLTLPKQVNDALDKINSIQLEDSTTVAILKNALEEGTTMLTNWLRNRSDDAGEQSDVEPDSRNLQCYQ